MESTSSAVRLRMGSGLSGHMHPIQAVEHACHQCADGMAGARTDLAVLFFSSHHVEAARAVAYAVRRRLEPGCLIGISAESVLGGEAELERTPGVALLAASLPGVNVRPFRTEELPAVREGTEAELTLLAAAAGMGQGWKATVVLADPFSVPINNLLPLLAKARPGPWPGKGGEEGAKRGPIIGGMASAAARPGSNVLILNDTMTHTGGVGVSLSGAVNVDTLVSQGCRPFGSPMVITGGKGQLISSLGGKPALEALSEALETLDERSRRLLQRGIFVGRAISEYKERFGRDDFVIRNVIGIDKNSASIAVADLIKVGQTVQFHLRDATTATEDLAMLLDVQRLYDPPAGALLFTCNGRGSRLFTTPNHDAGAVSRAFMRDAAAEEQAKGGVAFPERRSALPLAGFFAAGEIGPIGDEVFVHGQTACLALFRPEPGA